MKKFTFKTEKPTGAYRNFNRNHNYIKFNKIEVGSIDDKSPHKIRLQVMKVDVENSENPNCDWEWIQFARQFNSVSAAKEWLNENRELINRLYKIKNYE